MVIVHLLQLVRNYCIIQSMYTTDIKARDDSGINHELLSSMLLQSVDQQPSVVRNTLEGSKTRKDFIRLLKSLQVGRKGNLCVRICTSL